MMIRVSSDLLGGVWFAIAVDESKRLVACAFSDENQAKAEKAVTRFFPKAEVIRDNSPNQARLQQLHGLYKGKGIVGLDSVDFSYVSDFRKKVYHLLHQIPRGKVTTYGTLAKKMGMPQAARAVGTAVASNPLPLVVPCHRVVTSNLEILNYGTPGRKPSEGVYMKQRLLEHEGVVFQNKKVSTVSLWVPN
jgi:O-6-methylguanine DNA methyltransferase